MARADSTSSSLVKLAQMAEFKASVKKSTISSTKDSSRMTFTTVTEDTFIQMVITIRVIGSTVNGLAGSNWSTNLAKFMKAFGNTANS